MTAAKNRNSSPWMSTYGLVEQDLPFVVVHRRTERGFVREVYDGLDAVISLPEIDTELPLADIYDRVTFSPEPSDAEES